MVKPITLPSLRFKAATEGIPSEQVPIFPFDTNQTVLVQRFDVLKADSRRP